MKRLIVLLSLVVVAGVAMAGGAPRKAADAGGNWYAYLFDYRTQQVVRVDINGETTTYDFLPEGMSAAAGDIAISPVGVAAYCGMDSANAGSSPALFPTRLYLRDLNTDTGITEVDLGRGVQCEVGGFSPDGALVAVSIVRELPFVDRLPANMLFWELLIIDMMGQRGCG